MCLQKEIKKQQWRLEISPVSMCYILLRPVPKCGFLTPYFNFPSLCDLLNASILLSVLGVCLGLGCRDETRQWEYYDCHCLGSVCVCFLGGGGARSFRASKDTGCLLAGWQIVNYQHQTTEMCCSKICTDTSAQVPHWCPAETSHLSLSPSHTCSNICHGCCFRWCKPLLFKWH